MGKVAFHEALVVTGAVIWQSLFWVAAILDFAQTGHRRSSSICLRWFLKTLCPHLTPCQITKTSHQVHDHPEFPLSYITKYLLLHYFVYDNHDNPFLSLLISESARLITYSAYSWQNLFVYACVSVNTKRLYFLCVHCQNRIHSVPERPTHRI